MLGILRAVSMHAPHSKLRTPYPLCCDANKSVVQVHSHAPHLQHRIRVRRIKIERDAKKLKRLDRCWINEAKAYNRKTKVQGKKETEQEKSHLTVASAEQKSINFRTVDDEDTHTHAQLHAKMWIVDNIFCVVSFRCFWCDDDGGGAATVTDCVVTRVRSNLSIIFFLEGCERFWCGDNINQQRHCFNIHSNEKHVSEQWACLWPELDITSWNYRKIRMKKRDEFRSSEWVCSNINFLSQQKKNHRLRCQMFEHILWACVTSR